MLGLRHSPLYMINGVLMLVFFFFFRVVNMVLFFVEAVPRTQEFTTALGPVGTVLGAICIISGQSVSRLCACVGECLCLFLFI
eukprot:m.164520 g.164520  ORF g.164520 m.164520 type:complete len:83 (-) comp14400_c0_seq21:125-373(-)